MVSADTQCVVVRAKRLYVERLQVTLEASHRGQFVAIEPDSGDHFVSDTLDWAVRAARVKHPSRLSHLIRTGHPAAFHFGGGLVSGHDAAANRVCPDRVTP